MAGLMAARVLSDHFVQVTVLERDVLKADPGPRPGVPQSRHLPALLPRGLQILEAFFPGLSDEMQSIGAVRIDLGADVAWLTSQGWGLQIRSGLVALSSTRDLLEHRVRRRVAEIPNVMICAGTEVMGLLRGGSGEIGGVRTRVRSHELAQPDHKLTGDVVVITTGRHSAVAQWFPDVLIEAPAMTIVDAHIGYASRLYRRPKLADLPWRALILQSAPPVANRGGLMFAVEDDRWQVTLTGGDRDYPPTDEAGFLECAHSLRSPELYQTIREAEPLTTIWGCRANENRRRYFERIGEWPEGLMVMGDAACGFNPIYGQGVTAAALEAAALNRLLTDGFPGKSLAKTFQQEIAHILHSPWTLATSADLRFSSVEGASAGWSTRFMHSYIDRVLRLGTKDPMARQRFLEVQGMRSEIGAMLRPDMLARVLSAALRPNRSPLAEGGRAQPPTPPLRRGQDNEPLTNPISAARPIGKGKPHSL